MALTAEQRKELEALGPENVRTRLIPGTGRGASVEVSKPETWTAAMSRIGLVRNTQAKCSLIGWFCWRPLSLL